MNRVRWNPVTGHVLVSGSQDALVKVWDIRAPQKSTLTLNCNHEVRDLQYAPQSADRIVVALESGALQLWDVRNPGKPEAQVVAHQGMILCALWHPDRAGILATGGRDGQIRLWDLTGAATATHTIQTLADGVGRLAWRPGSANQLVSSATVTDCDLHLWDVEQPFVPLRSWTHHADIITDVQWHDDNALFTCSRDGRLARVTLEEGETHSSHLSRAAHAWSAAEHLTVRVSV